MTSFAAAFNDSPTYHTSDARAQTPVSPLEGEPLTPQQIFERAKRLAPLLAENLDRMEAERRIPADVHAQMLRAGVFRMNMPRLWGGPEMNPMQQCQVIEEVAKTSASAAWCIMIGSDSGIYASYLDDEAGRALYPRLDMVQAGWVAPIGKMRGVDGGYIASGKWAFASGIHNADMVTAGCFLVDDHDQPLLDDHGNRRWRLILAPKSEFTVLDTWHTSGLKGTGSNDYTVSDLFVPERNTFSFTEPAKRPGTLYARNDTFMRKMPAVPLGVARASIDYAVDVLQDKVDIVSGGSYRDFRNVQITLAEAEALVASARAYLYDALAAQWARLDANEPLTNKERRDVVISRYNAFQSCRKAVQMVYDTVGGSAAYTTKTPLDRNLRDLNTACQHIVGQSRVMEWSGKFMMGGDVTWPFL